MRILKTLTLLALLSGCASVSIEELELQVFACDRDKAIGCDELREELERRLKKQDEMIARQKMRDECPMTAKCYYGEHAYEDLMGIVH